MEDPSCAVHAGAKSTKCCEHSTNKAEVGVKAVRCSEDTDKWAMAMLDTIEGSLDRVGTYPKAMKYAIIINSVIQAVDMMSNSVSNGAVEMDPRNADRFSRVSRGFNKELEEMISWITTRAGPDGFVNQGGVM